MTSSAEKVAIIGSGMVGMNWALIFAAAGNKVKFTYIVSNTGTL